MILALSNILILIGLGAFFNPPGLPLQNWWFFGLGAIFCSGINLFIVKLWPKEILMPPKTSIDTIEHHRIQQALHESEARYKDLVEFSPLPIAVYIKSIIVYVNPAAIKLLGANTEKDVLERSLFDFIHPDSLILVKKRVQAMLKQEPLEAAEEKIIGLDNRIRYVEAQTRPITYQGQSAVLSIFPDVTERKRAEDQLRQSQKMEAIGRLAGGIAHDFNNLLTALIGYVNLAQRKLEPSHPAYTNLERVEETTQRTARLTRQLLTFTRQQHAEVRVFNLNEVILNADKLLRRLLGEDIELVIVLDPQLGLIKADAGQIEQVLVNLIVNARDAMPNGGKLMLETHHLILSESMAVHYEGLQVGPHILLIITDTGLGISPEVQEHIFEPFFTTKAIDKGTGLGLATCFSIIRQSNGHIQVESQMGEGTSFEIYLPVTDEAIRPDEMTSGKKAELIKGGNETILLVEDEDILRDLASQSLYELGYTVLEAHNGSEALHIIQTQSQAKIDLLLTDVVMPKIGGVKLADEFKRLYPQASVLFMSGYTDSAVFRRGLPESGSAFIAKPFTPPTLAKRVRDVLDQT